MALQYIGARYVPKFYNGSNGTEWDANTAYEALTIVTYLTNSYTSIKAVPASVGNPQNNPEYWASTGNYNAQVENLQQTVNELIIKNSKRYIVLCDSYGFALNESGENFYQQAFRLSGITDYQAFNSTGCGFVSDGSNTFLTLLNTNLSLITSKETVTDIIVLGGANDQGHEGDVPLAIYNFEQAVKASFPNARISIGFMSKDLNTTPILHLEKTIESYEFSQLYGVRYIANSEYIMARYTDFNSDLIHPSMSGILKLSKYFASFLNNGNIDVNEVTETTMQFGDDVNVLYNFSKQYQHNGIVSLKGQNGMLAMVTFKTPKTLTVGQNTLPDFFAFYDGFIIPMVNADMSLYSTYYEGKIITTQFSTSLLTSDLKVHCNGFLYANEEVTITSLIINPNSTFTIF